MKKLETFGTFSYEYILVGFLPCSTELCLSLDTYTIGYRVHDQLIVESFLNNRLILNFIYFYIFLISV